MENLVKSCQLSASFWAGKRVLLTGHTGFKGSWTSLVLKKFGAEILGISLDPATTPALFDILNMQSKVKHIVENISNYDKLSEHILSFQPNVIIHMAAQPLVRKSYIDPIETYQTNVMGTVNLLEAARKCTELEAILVVTTDKCYENNEWEWGYRETDRLGGFDPYSNSKACVELVCSCYRSSFFSDKDIAVATARAGNVIGGGDWSLDRLVPDLIKSRASNIPVKIRSPHSIRPWQHVIEPIYGYLMLAEKSAKHPEKFSEAWNFGPNDHDAVSVEFIAKYISSKTPGMLVESHEGDHPHEATLLKLDISKSRDRLNWKPKWSVNQALDKVLEWQEAFEAGHDMYEKSMEHISSYEQF